MDDFFKYITTGSEEKDWGIYLTSAGKSHISPNTVYPLKEHPTAYYFHWQNGRILHEYQIIYITEGSGELENEFGTFYLKKGCIFIVFPELWHRYKPTKNKGWTENYIGFKGKIINKLFNLKYFSPKQPVIEIKSREEIIDVYLKIFELCQSEKPGFQFVASGLILKLLGYLVSFEKQKGFSGKKIAQVIEDIRFEMRQNIEKEPDFKLLAREHNVSYSFFRKMFKKYTGVSPGQYHMQLRLTRAKELLVATDKSIKEISYELGFQSIFYFSNLFKKKEGVTPSYFRNKNIM